MYSRVHILSHAWRHQAITWNNVFISSKLFCGIYYDDVIKWEKIPVSLALCTGNSPVTGEFPAQRPVTRSFGLFFDLRLNNL